MKFKVLSCWVLTWISYKSRKYIPPTLFFLLGKNNLNCCLRSLPSWKKALKKAIYLLESLEINHLTFFSLS